MSHDFNPLRPVSWIVDMQLSELDRLPESQGQRRIASLASLDAYRDEGQLHVLIDLPGVSPSDIDLTVQKEVLVVKVERKWAPGESAVTLVTERPQGGVTRRLFLGETVDPTGIQAVYDQGVLEITIPVMEQAEVHKVQVTTKPGIHRTAIGTTQSA